MRWILVFTVSTLGGVASAQYAEYNRQRAYQHFLSSPAKVKVFSTGSPGYTQVRESPFEYRRFSVTGTYEQQRISPKGYERYRILPGYTIERASPYDYRYVDVPPLETFEQRPAYQRRPIVEQRPAFEQRPPPERRPAVEQRPAVERNPLQPLKGAPPPSYRFRPR